MGELLAVTCDSCGEPMVPNVSTLDDDGCGWICLNPGCPELAAGELEAEDLVEAGVPEALAGRLARLVAHYADAEEARARRTRPRGRASGRRPISRASARSCSSWGAWPKAQAPSPPTWTTRSSSRTTATTSPRPRTPSRRSPPSALSAPSSAAPPPTPRSRLAGVDSELPGLFIADEV